MRKRFSSIISKLLKLNRLYFVSTDSEDGDEDVARPFIILLDV